ncbi:MAG: hypothetical protein LBR32_06295 [Propionibacteriaceae bacterium]|jgi:membrane protein implicated in regulation of membrane protease activity|nr:hypothetical protein [Propionibacteriaceae bacterium]
MGLTGLIFAAIAAAWLVYLIPYFVQRRGLPEDQLEEAYASPTVMIVRPGADLSQAGEDQADHSCLEAKLAELDRIDARAAGRRRVVLVFLVVAEAVVSALHLFGVGAWWGTLVPIGLIGLFVVVAHASVRRMRRDLSRQARQFREEDEAANNQTVAIETVAGHEHSIEITVPTDSLPSLLAPIPVPAANRPERPVAPRTVRTISLVPPLSGPYARPFALEEPLDDTGLQRKAS